MQADLLISTLKSYQDRMDEINIWSFNTATEILLKGIDINDNDKISCMYKKYCDSMALFMKSNNDIMNYFIEMISRRSLCGF